VALTTEPWVGARALWRAGRILEVVVAFAAPDAIGLSALAGLIDPVPRSAPHALHLRLADSAEARHVVQAPLAPGLVVAVGVLEHRRLSAGETVTLQEAGGSLALDGERELELRPADRVEVTLDLDGPLVIDVQAAMAEAAERGLLATTRA
jgi:hypothetical protein